VEPKLPNFFLAGAPKAGTTSLCHYLDQHPEIYMSPIKAPNYFASEIRAAGFRKEDRAVLEREREALREYLDGPMVEKRFSAIVTEWSDYCRLFRNATNQIAIGEASDCYLWSADAAANIAARIPHAKIILVLRDPADRAFSQHLHHVSIGLTRWSFREHIDACLSMQPKVFGPAYPFLEMGLYYEQVKRFLDRFGAQNVRIYPYENFRNQPGALLADIFGWLGVDPRFVPDFSEKHLEFAVPKSSDTIYLLRRLGLWPRMKGIIPRGIRQRLRPIAFDSRRSQRMSPADRAFLVEYYRDDILKLAGLLGRDLSSWLVVEQ
jgi:hypothetical protein